MYTFIVRDIVSGVLLPLNQLVERLGLMHIGLWRFREITLNHGQPFGLSIQEFEKKTRDSQNGFYVSSSDFYKFLKTDFQIIDGVIEAFSPEDSQVCIVQLDCVDACQWEITTTLDELANDFERRGFQRQAMN